MLVTLFFYKSIFYKNIQDEICDTVKEHFKNVLVTETLKRINVFEFRVRLKFVST